MQSESLTQQLRRYAVHETLLEIRFYNQGRPLFTEEDKQYHAAYLDARVAYPWNLLEEGMSALGEAIKKRCAFIELRLTAKPFFLVTPWGVFPKSSQIDTDGLDGSKKLGGWRRSVKGRHR